MGPLGGFGGLRMGQQPLVPGSEPLVLLVQGLCAGGCGVGAPGQNHSHPETLALVDVAGGVVQGGGVDLYRHTGRDPEGFDLGCVQNAALNLVLFGQQQDKVAGAHIDLAVTVVLQTVELGVAAPAEPQLDGHPAVGVVLELAVKAGGLQGGDAGLVGGAALRQGDGLHGFQQAGDVVALQHLAVGGKSGVVDGMNFHGTSPRILFRQKSHSLPLMGRKTCAQGPTSPAHTRVPSPTTPPSSQPMRAKRISTATRTGPKGFPDLSLRTTATRSLGPVPASERMTTVIPKARITQPSTRASSRQSRASVSGNRGARGTVHRSIMGPPRAMHSSVPMRT